MDERSRQRSTWVVVPAFREAEAIGDVVSTLCDTGWQVVVVDDGSGDETSRRASAAGAWVLTHPVNLGQGAALRTGFAFALTRGDAEYVVTFDADGQHSVSAIDPMLARLVDGNLDVVLGSRFLDPRNARHVPASRRWLLRLATRFARVTTGLHFTDAHNGLRALRIAALRRMNLRQDRMAHASEIQHEIGRLGLRYAEVPVDITYSTYSRAKGQRAIDAVSVLWDMLISKSR